MKIPKNPQKVDRAPHLGVNITGNLDCAVHVETATNKATRALQSSVLKKSEEMKCPDEEGIY